MSLLDRTHSNPMKFSLKWRRFLFLPKVFPIVETLKLATGGNSCSVEVSGLIGEVQVESTISCGSGSSAGCRCGSNVVERTCWCSKFDVSSDPDFSLQVLSELLWLLHLVWDCSFVSSICLWLSWCFFLWRGFGGSYPCFAVTVDVEIDVFVSLLNTSMLEQVLLAALNSLQQCQGQRSTLVWTDQQRWCNDSPKQRPACSKATVCVSIHVFYINNQID